MQKNNYTPSPIDISDVVLPKELEQLAEKLAKNVHETWARGRIDDGWKYGPERDDYLKRHPGIVAYDELTEEEKDYDRVTSIGTLKLIIKLGWKIEKAGQV